MIKKIIKKALSLKLNDEDLRLKFMLVHKYLKGYPKVQASIADDINPTKQDLLLTKRLLIAYDKALKDKKSMQKDSYQDIWTVLEKGPYAEFIELLKLRNVNEMAFYLCNMARMGIMQGNTQGKNEYKKIKTNPSYSRFMGVFMLDRLVRLAEAFGVLPIENPEQGRFGDSVFSDVDGLIKKIENYLNISIIPPQIEGGLYKLVTKKGGIHHRDILALYTAFRCTQLLESINNPNICEIGAGVGKAAYYVNLLGIKQYTIFDLPHINFIQGFYLVKCLPSANIILYGEDSNKKNNYISIMPDFMFSKTKDKQFDLVFNEDSFPEINKNIVLDYLKQIRINTKGYFLSINQESQNTMMVENQVQHFVSDLVSESKEFERVYRFPYWMREGYVEELYKIK